MSNDALLLGSAARRGEAPHAGESARLDGVRLAIASDTWAPQLNGVALTLARLAAVARARGADVRVFTTSDPGAEEEEEIIRSPSLPFWAYPQLRLAAPSAAGMRARLVAWGAQLVHAATPFGIGLAARAAARRAGLPFVTSYHTAFSAYAHHYGMGALSAPGWKYLRWFHGGGVRTFCPTHAVARELEGRGFPGTTVWGRGVDTEVFSPRWRSRITRRALGIDDHELVVAYVGRVAREKGLETLVEAMHLLRGARDAPSAPISRLLIVGDGPWLEACRSCAPQETIFTGRRSGEELSRLYASADLFVFPSRTDTFGNVLLEAMASALPVVAADCAVSRELLAGVGVAFFPAGDSAALAHRISQLERAPDTRRAFGLAGRTRAEGQRWETTFDALFREYRAVLRSARPPARPPARAEAHHWLPDLAVGDRSVSPT